MANDARKPNSPITLADLAAFYGKISNKLEDCRKLMAGNGAEDRGGIIAILRSIKADADFAEKIETTIIEDYKNHLAGKKRDTGKPYCDPFRSDTRLKNLLKRIEAAAKEVGNVVTAFNAVADNYKEAALALITSHNRINERFGEVGVVTKEKDEFADTPIEYTDEGFENFLKEIKSNENSLAVMSRITEFVDNAPSTLAGIKSKIKKIEERLKLSNEANTPEVATAKLLKKKLDKAEEVIEERIMVVLTEFNERQRKYFNRALGEAEKLESVITRNALLRLAKKSMSDISTPLERLATINNKFQGKVK